jgi:hypothetical protein
MGRQSIYTEPESWKLSSQKPATLSCHDNFVHAKKSLRRNNNCCFNFSGIGNTTAAAEFNFYCDPEAAHVVIRNMKCPITILPWEAAYKYGRIPHVSTLHESLSKPANSHLHDNDQLVNAV